MIFTRYGYHGHIFGMRIYDDLSWLSHVIFIPLDDWLIIGVATRFLMKIHKAQRFRCGAAGSDDG